MSAFGSSPAGTSSTAASYLEEGELLLVAAPCGSGSSSSSRTVPLCPVMGTCQRHSPGELKIDLGHPFATSARIAHGLPVGEAALIKRTIFKEPGCREEEVLIGWWQWLRCRTGLGWVPVLQGDPHTQKKHCWDLERTDSLLLASISKKP